MIERGRRYKYCWIITLAVTAAMVGERMRFSLVGRLSFSPSFPVLIILADQLQEMLQSQAMFPAGPTLDTAAAGV